MNKFIHQVKTANVVLEVTANETMEEFRIRQNIPGAFLNIGGEKAAEDAIAALTEGLEKLRAYRKMTDAGPVPLISPRNRV